MRFQDCSKREQAWIIFGAVLVCAGFLLLLFSNSSWWSFVFMWLRRLSRLAIPIALIGVGAYAIWCARSDRLNHLYNPENARSGSLSCSSADKRITGLCGGIAQYFGVNSTLVRIITILLALASPLFTGLVYLILSLVLDKR